LFYGGILLYPDSKTNPDGVINIFEAFAISHVFERSWGRASCGEIGTLLKLKPTALD
jgi:fructose-1,6-bisphosphatase